MVIPSIDKPISKAAQRALDKLDNKIRQEKARAERAEQALDARVSNNESHLQDIDLQFSGIDIHFSAIDEERNFFKQQLCKIAFTIPSTIWQQGVQGIRYLPKITFDDNTLRFADNKYLLILRSYDPLFTQYEIKLVGYGHNSSGGYILIDCDYCSKGDPSFPNQDIDCILYMIPFNERQVASTCSYIEQIDEAWLNPAYVPTTESVDASVTQNGSTLEVE